VKCLAIDETPVFIDISLHELQIEIDDNISGIGKNAYLLSQLTVNGRSFINSKEFRLRFLRFELFDIQKSAIRMLKWMDNAFSLFGSLALERPICILTDFSSHELKIFRKGYIQLMPVRASGTGRRIICAIPYDEEWYTISRPIIQKIMMYTCWVIGNDIDTQRKGVAVVSIFDSSFPQNMNRKGAGKLLSSGHWIMSVRLSAIHICTPDTPFFRLRRHFLAIALGSHNRARLKFHLGTSIELRYKLQVYGIPIEFIPVTFTGKIKLSYVRQWLRLRYMIEDQEKPIAINHNNNNIINTDNYNDNYNDNDNDIVVESPYLGDVLFKQGDSFTSHPGNNTLRYLIEWKLNQLHKVENNKPQLKGVIEQLKKTLVLEIMDEIEHKHSGRFLYWHQSNDMCECWWVLLHLNGNKDDQEVIFSKIDYLFRKTYSKKQQQQKVIRTKHMKQQELIHKKNDTGQNNGNRNEKRKFECNNNDSLIAIDPPITSNSTTINQNGGTFLFHSLDGNKRNKAQGLLSLNRNDDSSSGGDDASECFGKTFVPFSTDNSKTHPH
jgi:hypothetical protein